MKKGETVTGTVIKVKKDIVTVVLINGLRYILDVKKT